MILGAGMMAACDCDTDGDGKLTWAGFTACAMRPPVTGQ